MKLRLAAGAVVLLPLFGCAIPSYDVNQTLLGTIDLSSDKEKSSSDVQIRLPIDGTLSTSPSKIRIDIVTQFVNMSFTNFSCQGGQTKGAPQAVVDIALTCSNGRSGNAFVNLVHDRDDLGQGQFSLSDGSIGVFRFGEKFNVRFVVPTLNGPS